MASNTTNPEIQPEDIRDFLNKTPPFDLLDPITLDGVASHCRTEYVPDGRVIMERGKTAVNQLRLVYQGRVKVFLRDETGEVTLEDIRGPGQAIGQLALLRHSLSNLDVVTQEDTVFILLDRDHFLQLVKSNVGFSNHYLTALSEGYVSKALERLERPQSSVAREGSLYLFSAQVGDIIRRRPETISGREMVKNAARMMSERRVGCLLVTSPEDRIVGIITDRDLRNKVVAQGLEVSTPVERIMTSSLHTIPAQTVCFDALLEMMKHRVHHLVVEKGGRITGVLSGHDLMVIQGSSPLYLVRQIQDQKRIEDLYDIALQSPRVVGTLLREGAKARHITRMITLINDYILDRILALTEDELGSPPRPYTWLLMGSEGRREQTFRTDQDNGLLYDDGEGEEKRSACGEYFKVLGEKVVKSLVASGVPACKGGIMASNPQWCQSYSTWAGYFDDWISSPRPKELLQATIFFDFRSGWGDRALGGRLRDHLMRAIQGQEVFFRHLANDCLATAQGLSFFRQFAVEKTGKYRNKIDLKTKGLTPIVDFARLMSLRAGIRETNTWERLDLLGEEGYISREMQERAAQVFTFMMQLRLLHQQAQDEEGAEPDNHIDPRELSDLDRMMLKESFGLVGMIKDYLREAFQLVSV